MSAYSFNPGLQPSNMGSFSSRQAIAASVNPPWLAMQRPTPFSVGLTSTHPNPTDSFTRKTARYETIKQVQDDAAAQPDITLRSFSELTPENVRCLGDVRGLIFDVDDTLSHFQLLRRTIPTALKIRLKTLQDNGFKLGGVSNNPSSNAILALQQELANAGIHMAVVCNAKKPNPTALKMMQQSFNLAPSQVLMVGDSPLTDMQGGNRAGFKTAQVDWFDNDTGHKAAMIGADVALLTTQKAKQAFSSDPMEPPRFYPPQGFLMTPPMGIQETRQPKLTVY